tara:strand:- start:14041 stop:14346 length:306 start_codon:yes stop_codon:yes gene_type:complete
MKPRKLNPFTVSAGQLRVLIYLDRLPRDIYTFPDLHAASVFAGYPPKSCRFSNLQASGLLNKLDVSTYELSEDALRLLIDFQKLFESDTYITAYKKQEEKL